jgi:hypothetical protein
VSLNLVGNDNKDKQCVMRYETPRLKIILKTAVDAQRRVEMIERREIPTFELHLITIKNPCINLPSRPVPAVSRHAKCDDHRHTPRV